MIRSIGLRGCYLGFLSVGFFAYGVGLIAGYQPTFLSALGASTRLFGYVWTVVAIAVSTGIWISRDALHFLLAVIMMAFWAIVLITFWKGGYGWAAGISWLTLMANTILVGIWPNLDPPLPPSHAPE